MSAAGLRASMVFCGEPLIPPWLRTAPHYWPHPGAHTDYLKVIDWKVIVLQNKANREDEDACLCLRCACYRNYLPVGTCRTRAVSLDLPLLVQAYSNFAGKPKLRGVLFEAREQWRQKARSVALASQEQVRSTVCMHFTSW